MYVKFQGLVGTRLASCSMAELVTEHAEIVAGLQRISRRQLLECRVALLYQNIGARPTSKGSSATAQPATERLLSLKPKRRARPSHAPSSSFAEVSAARSQARGAERIRDNRFPTRGPESISRSPLQRRRIHQGRSPLQRWRIHQGRSPLQRRRIHQAWGPVQRRQLEEEVAQTPVT